MKKFVKLLFIFWIMFLLDFMKSLSRENHADIIRAFKRT